MTYTATACPCCEATDLNGRDALIAPFIARYLLDQPASRCRILHCRSCDAMFFDQRLDHDEISRLYDGYRGETYYAARHACEPWYTRRFNDRIGDDQEIEVRKTLYQKALAPWCSAGVDSVLDFAGDAGQLMPGGPGREHWVYDISGVPTVEGVRKIDGEAGLSDRAFDLVLLCHVVEHFSAPLQEMIAVAGHVHPGGLLYVEAPLERFSLADIPEANWYRRYLDALTRSPTLMKLADFWSTAVRVKFRRIAPMAFVKLHEHLNYFNATSLSRLLENAGIEVLDCLTPSEMDVVIAVGRRRSAAAA